MPAGKKQENCSFTDISKGHSLICHIFAKYLMLDPRLGSQDTAKDRGDAVPAPLQLKTQTAQGTAHMQMSVQGDDCTVCCCVDIHAVHLFL